MDNQLRIKYLKFLFNITNRLDKLGEFQITIVLFGSIVFK